MSPVERNWHELVLLFEKCAGRGLVLGWALSFALVSVADARRLPVSNYSVGILGQVTVNEVLQDRDGIIWVATQSGLIRYDGNNFTSMGRKQGLTHIFVTDIAEDAQGKLWAASLGGLGFVENGRWVEIEGVADDASQEITQIVALSNGAYYATTSPVTIGIAQDRAQTAQQFDISGVDAIERVNQLLVFGEDRLLAATSGAGLVEIVDGRAKRVGKAQIGFHVKAIQALGNYLLVATEKGVFRLIMSQLDFPPVPILSADSTKGAATAFAVDSQGRLFVGTRSGIWLHDQPSAATPVAARHIESTSSYAIKSLLVRSNGTLWGTTKTAALRFSLNGKSPIRLDATTGLEASRVLSLFEDRESTIWLGTNQGLWKHAERGFINYRAQDGLPDDAVWAITRATEVPGAPILVGTGSGLGILRDDGWTTIFKSDGLIDDTALSLLAQGSTVYVGGLDREHGGVTAIEFIENEMRFTRYGKLSGLLSGRVYSFALDGVGRLLAGTAKGLAVLEDGIFQPITLPTKEQHTAVYAVNARDGIVWAGTREGLVILKGAKQVVLGIKEGLSGGAVRSVSPRGDGEVMIRYRNSLGVSRLRIDPLTLKVRDIKHWTVSEGLPADSVYYVGQAAGGQTWIGTLQGVAWFDGDSVRVLDETNGLVLNDCTTNAFYGDTDGSVWLGTSGGVSHYNPARDTAKAELAPMISKMTSMGMEVPVGEEIASGANEVGFEFTARSYLNEESIRYRHRIVGMNTNWSQPIYDGFVRFHNLPPGDYLFEVQAQAAGGKWSEESATRSFTILAALHQTWWFALGVVLAVLSLVGVVFRWRTRSLRRAQHSLEVMVEQRTEELRKRTEESDILRMVAEDHQFNAEAASGEAWLAKEEADQLRSEAEQHADKLKELDKQKTAFFQNMSHELRTPLTLILNPLQEAAERYQGDQSIEVAAKNSRRLLRLVNQLLDFQKLEAGKQRLKRVPIDLVGFLLICADYFASACLTKGVEFITTYNNEPLEKIAEAVYVLGEVDALEKITFNFLSNALKYTPEGGQIELGLKIIDNNARVFIRDTGPGISEDGKKQLFQVFSQVDETTTRDYEGTGLGLALVKSLTEEMEGEVGIESKVGEGSTFWAEFPLSGARKNVVDVLILDDEEPICRSLFKLLLRDEHIHSVQTAQSCESACKLLEESSFRVVICDEGLRHESGTDFLAELTTLYPDMRRVLFTGNDSLKLMEKAVNEAWVHQIILKPFEPVKLVEAVSRLVQDSPILTEDMDEAFEVKAWLLEAGEGKTGQDDTGVFNVLETISEGSGDLVLVVDDLPDMRDLIGNALKKKNYRVATAPNGKRGFKIAKEIHPNLIITDWRMPQMSGPDLIEAIRKDELLQGIPIILLTAKSDEESKLIGKDIGADAFLGKPFNAAELGSTVQNLIRLKSGEKEIVKLNHMLTEVVLKRYLPPDLVDQITRGEFDLASEPHERVITILFSDLCGFTQLGEILSTVDYVAQLNEYLTFMNEIIFSHYGTVDKFMGDAIMVFFGAPQDMAPFIQAQRATTCARAMQAGLEALNDKWVKRNLPPLSARIGIHQGKAVVGNIGSDKRADYTCIGSAVNLTSRIEAVCSPGSVFMSEVVAKSFPDEVTDAGEFELKGITGKVPLYRLI